MRYKKFVLPETQRASAGWAVQWRRGNENRDTYELVYKGHYEGGVVVTGEGWKWYRHEHRGLRTYNRFSDETFPTWEAAVAAFVRAFRRTTRGRGARIPARDSTEWINIARRRPNGPWTPRPIHPDFDTFFATRESS